MRHLSVLLVGLMVLTTGACGLLSLSEETGGGTGLLVGKTWTWVETYDPYDGGQTYGPGPDAAGHTFVFGADHRFVEDHPGGCCRYEGTWRLEASGSRLVLEAPGQSSRTYEVRTLTRERLKLACQGRHGMVVETFHGEGIRPGRAA